MDSDLLRIKFIVFDFDGVFTDNRVIVNERGEESVICSRSEGAGLDKLRKIGIDLMVLSSEVNKVVQHRAKKLDIYCVNACENKLQKLKEEAQKRGVSFENICYVGNDINDLECLETVGFPVVVADAHDDVIPIAKYQTKKNGGDGAVREICDLIYSRWSRSA